MGSLLAAKSTTEYQKNDPYFSNDKVWEDFANWAANVPVIDYGKYTYEADEAIMNLMPSFLDGTKTLEEFLQAAETAADSKVQ